MSEQPSSGRRVVVLTALPLEYKAVRAHLSRIHEEVYRGTVYEKGLFFTENGPWQVSIVQIGAGNIGTAVEAERAIIYFKPDILLFIGIAGGLKDVQIGDVVVSTKVYGYESGKAGEQKIFPRPEIGLSSYRLVQRAMAEARKEDWQQRIRQPDLLLDALSSPRVFIGPIAAGEKVLASRQSETFLFLQQTYNDALAVEMEGLGFLQAVQRNETVQALVVRGISDLLDQKQLSDAKGSQFLAASHASAFAFEVLARLDVPGATPTLLLAPTIRLIDFHISEEENAVLIDITLYNGETKPIFPSRAVIETFASGVLPGIRENTKDQIRSYVRASQVYEMVLSSRAESQLSTVKIAHILQPGEVDRFQLRVTHEVMEPGVVAVWFQARVSIFYDTLNSSIQSDLCLFTLPPLTEKIRQSWQQNGFDGTGEMLRSLAKLPGTRSASLDIALRHLLDETYED